MTSRQVSRSGTDHWDIGLNYRYNEEGCVVEAANVGQFHLKEWVSKCYMWESSGWWEEMFGPTDGLGEVGDQ